MATRYPRQLQSNSSFLKVFSDDIWTALVVSIVSLSLTILTIYFVYDNYNLRLTVAKLDVSQIMIRCIAGITEPDDGAWFETYTAGGFIMIIWYLANFFFTSFYW